MVERIEHLLWQTDGHSEKHCQHQQPVFNERQNDVLKRQIMLENAYMKHAKSL